MAGTIQKNAFEIKDSFDRISQKAIEIAREDLLSEEAARGWLPPSRIVAPLANGGYSKEEYAMMERDRGKYILYAAATREAIYDIVRDRLSTNPNDVELTALVPGCGRGRLVQFIIDAVEDAQSELCQELSVKNITIKIWALDANPIAISSCRTRFSAYTNVHIVGPLPIYPGMKQCDLPPILREQGEDSLQPPLHRCDLIVSELLGSFVDNEFMTAVSKTLRSLFLNTYKETSVMIPDSYETYIAPISCPRAVDLLTKLSRPLNAPYNMSLSDDVLIWGDFVKLWNGKCYEPQHIFEGVVNGVKLNHPRCSIPCSSTITQTATAGQAESSVTIHGLVGFFTSHLYGNYVIDTRPQLFSAEASGPEEVLNRGRNSMHWEAFLFPLPEPLHLVKGDCLTLKVSQLSFPPSTTHQAMVGFTNNSVSMTKEYIIGKEEVYTPAIDDEMWYEWEVSLSEDNRQYVSGWLHRITLGSNNVPPSISKDASTPDNDHQQVGEGPKRKHAKLLANASQWKGSK